VRFDAKRPRDDPRWPEVGVLAHRHARRLNALGVSRCRLIRVDGLELHVEDLDAIDATRSSASSPDSRRWARKARSASPSWPGDMLRRYYAPTQLRPA
jgi:hypothetical protein